ncbi:hypothetical protein [Noviherbaspirillum aerium]|uniref:hypothetical protein n=1 Tax=Noviherbaspirillum aerium TaxID=2588497 RepID=UPI00124E66F4|nr:hypothetical protein [Noviherbaspirillum aerium]
MKLQQQDDVAGLVAEPEDVLVRQASGCKESGPSDGSIQGGAEPAEHIRMRDPYFQYELI